MQMAFSLLRERLDFPAESREADLIQTVDEEMSRLVLLINDLLNFSRYQTGMQKLELASCDLVDLLTQAQQRFIPKGEARRSRCNWSWAMSCRACSSIACRSSG